MYCDFTFKLTRFDHHRNRDAEYGEGTTTTNETVEARGMWEFDHHPNIDAYAFGTYGYDSFDLLLGYAGFDPAYDFEIDYDSIDVQFTGTDDEWIELAEHFHDGYYAEIGDLETPLGRFLSWEEFDLDEHQHARILEKLN